MLLLSQFCNTSTTSWASFQSLSWST